jgi:hypothetical protein
MSHRKRQRVNREGSYATDNVENDISENVNMKLNYIFNGINQQILKLNNDNKLIYEELVKIKKEQEKINNKLGAIGKKNKKLVSKINNTDNIEVEEIKQDVEHLSNEFLNLLEECRTTNNDSMSFEYYN